MIKKLTILKTLLFACCCTAQAGESLPLIGYEYVLYGEDNSVLIAYNTLENTVNSDGFVNHNNRMRYNPCTRGLVTSLNNAVVSQDSQKILDIKKKIMIRAGEASDIQLFVSEIKDYGDRHGNETSLHAQLITIEGVPMEIAGKIDLGESCHIRSQNVIDVLNKLGRSMGDLWRDEDGNSVVFPLPL